jgi:RNA polymerase sigma-70 factor (family 1)
LEIVRDFSETDCLRQLKLDDERAFDALFRHYRSLVYRFAYSYLKSRVEAEEIVQDCFLKIWEKRQHLREDAPLKGYLFTTAHHAILNHLRRSQHHLRFQTHVAALSPEVATNGAEYSEMEALYRAALEKLPPKRRQIFMLSRQQGLSYPEIAKELNLSVKTVETQIMQALKFMRTYFRAHGSEVLGVLLVVAVSVR